MADEPEVTPSEAPDDSAPADVVASEAATEEAPAVPKTDSASEREAFLNEVAKRVAEQLRPALTPPTPPTTAAVGHDPLEAEAQAILDEKRALTERVQREGGWTAETLLKNTEITDRTSALRSEVTLRGLKEMEAQRRVDSLGSEGRWQEYYRANRHRGDVELLRAAFERDELRAAAEATKPPAPAAPKPKLDRPAVDVSGPSEVTAAERKARTMTMEQVHAEKARLKEAGNHAAIRELDAKLRNGDVILK